MLQIKAYREASGRHVPYWDVQRNYLAKKVEDARTHEELQEHSSALVSHLNKIRQKRWMETVEYIDEALEQEIVEHNHQANRDQKAKPTNLACQSKWHCKLPHQQRQIQEQQSRIDQESTMI